MAKFLAKGSYTAEGTRGLIKDGGSARVAAVTKMIAGLGGTVEAFYFAYGGADVYLIVDLADEAAGLALSLAVNASGAVSLELVPLITAAQMDAAAKKSVGYKVPGA